jgi:lysophospholipase L1-like esterase
MSTSSAIAELFANCLSVRETDEGYAPLRFTEAQLAHYAKTEMFRIRSRCTAGVIIDAMTDSTFIEIEYEVRSSVRDWLYFDMYVDNAFRVSLGSRPIGARCAAVRYDLPCPPGGLASQPSARRITVYLPQNVELLIRRIGFSEGAAYTAASPAPRRLLCFGDSITQGMEAMNPSCTYAALLARALGYTLLNQGVGGHFFDPESLDPALPYKPDAVTVAYGTNDWGRCACLADFRTQCAAYLEKVVQLFPRTPIYAITPFWRRDHGTDKPMGSFASIGSAIAEVCADLPGVSVVDGLLAIPHQDRFFGDGLHPTDEGFAHIALYLAGSMAAQKTQPKVKA